MRNRGTIIKLIMLAAIWGAFVMAYQHMPTVNQRLAPIWNRILQFVTPSALEETKQTETALPAIQVDETAKITPCDTELPPHGQLYKFAHHEGIPVQGNTYLVSNLPRPALLQLYNSKDNGDEFAIFLHPKQALNILLPEGVYELALDVGDNWCNIQRGFVEGESIESAQLLFVQKSRTNQIKLSTFGAGLGDIIMAVSENYKPNQTQANGISGNGELELYANNRHYFIDGTINGKAAQFIVDTGASYIAVSESFAHQAGIHDCTPSQTVTANGIAKVCLAYAQHIQIGPFSAQHMMIAYSPGISNDFLLGMEFLRHFKVEQKGNVMKISN